MLDKLKKDLLKCANPEKAKILSKFFKTGNGQYGEGDVFLGVTVPEQRRIATKYPEISLKDLRHLLRDKTHEHRLVALLILIIRYRKANETGKGKIFDFYLRNTKNINSWDLVDLSAERILGDYLLKRDRLILYRLAKSDNLWVRRIAIMSTFAFIKNNQFKDTLNISKILLNDKHDLIHKAVGWMLREIGKRNQLIEEQFLKNYYPEMPRTMLRYAIEKFDEKKRKSYLKKN